MLESPFNQMKRKSGYFDAVWHSLIGPIQNSQFLIEIACRNQCQRCTANRNGRQHKRNLWKFKFFSSRFFTINFLLETEKGVESSGSVGFWMKVDGHCLEDAKYCGNLSRILFGCVFLVDDGHHGVAWSPNNGNERTGMTLNRHPSATWESIIHRRNLGSKRAHPNQTLHQINHSCRAS